MVLLRTTVKVAGLMRRYAISGGGRGGNVLGAVVRVVVVQQLTRGLELFAQHDLGAEVATSGTPLCKCCSEGTVPQQRAVRAGTQPVLLGAHEPDARSLLDEWAGAQPQSRSWSNLHTAH